MNYAQHMKLASVMVDTCTIMTTAAYSEADNGVFYHTEVQLQFNCHY